MENLSEEARADLYLAEYGERAANLDHDDVVAQKLFDDFHSAFRDAAQYAIDTVQRAIERCVKTVDFYIECEMYCFEEVHTFLQKEMYLQLVQFKHNANSLYWKQLMVLDRSLMDCSKEENITEIRRRFSISCYLPICAKVRQMRLHFDSMVASAIEHREDEIKEMMNCYKQMDVEVALGKVEERKESDLPFDEYYYNGVQICAWRNTKIKKPESDSAACTRIKKFLDNEISRSNILCDAITQFSIEYSQGAIDSSLESDVPIFDDFVHRASEIVDAALRSSDKVMRKIIKQFSARSGQDSANMAAEYYFDELYHLKRDNENYFRGEYRQLDQYRIKERVGAIEKERARKKAEDEIIANKHMVYDEDGKLGFMSDIDLTKYEITNPIGGGGQGAIYPFELSGKRVVAKKFHNEKAQLEIRNYCQISGHENILRMICRGHRDDEKFLILEYCPGSLADELRALRGSNTALDKSEYITWIRQIADGMIYLHKQSYGIHPELYHGDLKPENILITEDRTIRIADFGVSLFLAGSVGIDENKELGGTLNYMAPELHRSNFDRKLLQKADVWSWGVVVWEMMANRLPYGTHDHVLLRMQIGKNSLHPPLPSGTIESLENLLRQCWSEPESRPNFMKIRRQIEDVAEEIDGSDEKEWLECCSEWRSA